MINRFLVYVSGLVYCKQLDQHELHNNMISSDTADTKVEQF